MAKGKNFAGWVPGDFVERAERIVRDEHGGNQSEFVAGLVVAAVKGAPPRLKDNSAVMIELASHYHPTLVEEFEAVLAKRNVNQRRLAARFLEALSRALADPKFDPDSEFDLVDRTKRAEWEAMSGERLAAIARELADNLRKTPLSSSPATEEIERERKRREAEGETGGTPPTPRKTAQIRPAEVTSKQA